MKSFVLICLTLLCGLHRYARKSSIQPVSYTHLATTNAAEGGNALFAGCVYGSLGELYLFCYANESGDSLKQHREQDVVTYYMNAGATDVRLRTFGGRRFICYRATVDREDGEETWDTYETWDGDIQLTFETRMSPGDEMCIRDRPTAISASRSISSPCANVRCSPG